MRQLILFFLWVAGIGLTVATVVAHLGQSHWLFDLIANFRMHIAVLLLFCFLLGVLLAKKRKWFALLLPGLVINGLAISPLFFPLPTASAGETIRIMSYNVYGSNSEYTDILTEITNHDPDVLLLIEVRPGFAAQLGTLEYAHQHIEPQDGNYGIALLSRLPFAQINTVDLGSNSFNNPAIQAIIDTGTDEGEFAFIGVHPARPVSADEGAHQDMQLKRARALLTDSAMPSIIAGDFNATIWSYRIAEFEAAGWRTAHLGYGFQPTWQHRTYNIPGLPIDHILISDAFTVASFGLGESAGSDHRPIIADLHLKPAVNIVE